MAPRPAIPVHAVEPPPASPSLARQARHHPALQHPWRLLLPPAAAAAGPPRTHRVAALRHVADDGSLRLCGKLRTLADRMRAMPRSRLLSGDRRGYHRVSVAPEA